MTVFENNSYKQTIKQQLAKLKGSQKSLTLRRLASEIPIQYTFLSRALSESEDIHLNEDHLFFLCDRLEFHPEEREFIILQRQLGTAHDPKRKKYIQSRIEEIRLKTGERAKQLEPSAVMGREMSYLLEPRAWLLHAALNIPAYRKDPRLLLPHLSISMEQLREFLRILSQNDFISLAEDGLTVLEIKQSRLHIGKTHPLMRLHQQLIRSQLATRSTQSPESDKVSFFVTFNMDDKSFEKVKDEFKTFLGKIENIARDAKDEGVYQLAFDLLRWF
jgi:hypothetical protein